MRSIAIILVLQTAFVTAQNAPGSYFQQQADYRISVTLDDKEHQITGHLAFDYTNHSPDTLREIWMHVWGNAYKNRHTAFNRQKLRDGSMRFHFAREQELGQFKGLDFSVNDARATWNFDPENPDIARIDLATPLLPGQKITVSTPLVLKIPASFSRLGHVGTSYQMTQWYPKPAVYDNKGWHAMPYLDQGEFYSEFGSFDVSITLPENYVVGATGVLQNPEEVDFLNRQVQETREKLRKGFVQKEDPFPASSGNMKTIRYTAEKVHDFAWFADKRFMVVRDTAVLASGKKVDCWGMFTRSEANLWTKGAFYVRRAVEYYSERVGEYPWPQATAVHSALSAGGGMEYPMITVIGNSGSAKDLDDVITHEVGHNWFYGILASNEREHPFMDEGLNSYYESCYMDQYYGNYTPFELPKGLYDPAKLGTILEQGYLLLARDHQDTPPDTHSAEFAPVAYGLMVYMKTALCMKWLEKAVGRDKLDAAMQDYYRKWQFKHPYPEDLKHVLQENGLSVDWFFNSLQTKKRADYALKDLKKGQGNTWELHIKQKGDLSSPFPVTALYHGRPVATQWYDPARDFAGKAGRNQRLQLSFHADSADAFVIDRDRVTLELNRKNNNRRTSGLFPGSEPLQWRMLAPFQNANKNTVGILPWIGWNNSDKTMLGLLLYNPLLPPRRVQVYLLPGFGLGSKQPVGLADIRFRFYPGGVLRKITAGAGFKSFDLDFEPEKDRYYRFYRLAPEIRADLKSASVAFSHSLNFRTLFTGRETAVFDSAGTNTGKKWDRYVIHELRYDAAGTASPNPFQLRVALENQQFTDALKQKAQYWKAGLTWRQQLFFHPKRKFTYRMFAGYFLKNTQRNGAIVDPYTALSLNPQGFNDYKYDQIFLARTGGAGILGRQVSQTEGGFKGAFGAAFAAEAGNSNNYILALNLKSDLPVRLPWGIPVKPYFDLGYFDDATPTGENRPSKEQLLWNGGLMLEFFKGGLEVYFPLVSSPTLKNLYCQQGGGGGNSGLFCGGNYLQMISWSLRIGSADPLEIIQKIVR